VSDILGSGAMLFGPEHALKVAAEAIETEAQSSEMAVGIVLGIRAAIVEYNRLFTTAPSAENPVPARSEEQPADAPTQEIKTTKETAPAARVRALARA
jgi:hypothetical protein